MKLTMSYFVTEESGFEYVLVRNILSFFIIKEL